MSFGIEVSIYSEERVVSRIKETVSILSESVLIDRFECPIENIEACMRDGLSYHDSGTTHCLSVTQS